MIPLSRAATNKKTTGDAITTCHILEGVGRSGRLTSTNPPTRISSLLESNDKPQNSTTCSTCLPPPETTAPRGKTNVERPTTNETHAGKTECRHSGTSSIPRNSRGCGWKFQPPAPPQRQRAGNQAAFDGHTFRSIYQNKEKESASFCGIFLNVRDGGDGRPPKPLPFSEILHFS